MKARVKWLDHISLVGESASGHSVVMDGPPDVGGRNLGIRPMEMVLLGLGGCSAIDVLHILQKARQPITGCEIELEAERADAVPAVFTQIHMKFIIFGHDLSDKQVARAVDLSADKYCSVSKMLEHGVKISHSYEIRTT
ncbi:MAG: OsmC family protein [Gammaproteobacteria bacterium]|nr:OsmC family protein [Gammaproteobacteria bacterium]